MTPPAMGTGRSLRLALEGSDVPPFDDDYAFDIAAALAMVSDCADFGGVDREG